MAFAEFLRLHPTDAAPVSEDFPLISNQDVYLNIALIKQYHENMKKDEARQLALNVLKSVDLLHIAFKRNASLSHEERFLVMLLRAAMIRNAVILIDRPFQMVSHWQTCEFLINVLKKIDHFFSSCHIYDYSWLKEKYGDLCL